MVKEVKNGQKYGDNNEFFYTDSLFFASESAINSQKPVIRSSHSFIRLLFFKERRQRIDHGCSLRRAILSKRVKSERANSQPCKFCCEYLKRHTQIFTKINLPIKVKSKLYCIEFFFFNRQQMLPNFDNQQVSTVRDSGYFIGKVQWSEST